MTGNNRQPPGTWLLAIGLLAAGAAFASRVMTWNTVERISFLALVLVAVWVMSGMARSRYPSSGEGKYSAAVSALFGAALVGMVLGLFAGDAYLRLWPDPQSLVMTLIGLGLGLFWLQPWYRRSA